MVKSDVRLFKEPVHSRPTLFITSSPKTENIAELSRQSDVEFLVQFLWKVSKHDIKNMKAVATCRYFILSMLFWYIAPALFDFTTEWPTTAASTSSHCNKNPSVD